MFKEEAELLLEARYLVLTCCVLWGYSPALAMRCWVPKVPGTGVLLPPPRSTQLLTCSPPARKQEQEKGISSCLRSNEWYHRQGKQAVKGGWEQNPYIFLSSFCNN